MIDEFDPFRDGKAVERMGQYLTWLWQGLHQGQGRQQVLAAAAQRYAQAWGEDKIIKVNTDE